MSNNYPNKLSENANDFPEQNEIPTQICRLIRALADLESSFGSLLNRLEPIMEAEGVTPKNPQEVGRTSTSLGSSLYTCASRVEDLHNRLCVTMRLLAL